MGNMNTCKPHMFLRQLCNSNSFWWWFIWTNTIWFIN